MNRVSVTKKFFDTDTNRKVENAEFMTFWKSLSDDEKNEFSNAAAIAIGETITA